MQKWTIKGLLDWVNQYLSEKKVDSARLGAELILSYILEKSRIELYTHFDMVVEKPQLDRLHQLVKRAGEHEPVAYLVGKCEFYSLEIFVDSSCLIPRPETELLVEKAIDFLRRQGQQKPLVCDLCTGSGCVAAAIAKNHPSASIIATDISEKALVIAAKNIAHHKLNDRVELLCGDLFEPVIKHVDKDAFDLIVSNPPYVSAAEFQTLDRNVKDYEPQSALLAGEAGLDVYRKIAANIDGHLKVGGAVMLEIGYSQAEAVTKLLEAAAAFGSIKVEKDFAGNDRLITARKCQ
ncbi:MAG: peptide chain release factor N(5)-glutamine methyltransferase [Planctomycetes bacterium]|nr:peptide chain release factor N(5)-glutamine methyltransferase [Planctomycetota bacterium]MBL7106558.1 peptide chain release factor N(5)-glutamine methyltransferase [Phycisphaerae bacterium]